MKKVIMNIFTTTGCALVILAALEIIIFFHIGNNYYIPLGVTTFQILAANIVIHLGLLLTRKFESQYLFLDFLLDVVFITIVLVIFGSTFNWFYNWFTTLAEIVILASMAVVIYVVGTFFKMGRIREEINEINKLLEERDKRSKRKNGR